MRRRILSIVLLAVASLGVCAQTFDIRDYGEVGDTTRTCTEAIQRAIDACHSVGGGRVLVPAGVYKSGTLVLKDNVELHLSSGARLVASADDKDFKVFPPTSYRSLKDAGGWVSLLYADSAKHISITGRGVIDGRGLGRKGFINGVAGDCNGRPRNILFISCQDVTVKDITMRNSALWNQHYLNCEDVLVSGIRVWNHCNGNNDGIDIDGCRRFVLSNSIIDSDDDGIVLKSTGTAPCEDVLVTGCVVSSYANAIKLGTESTGGYRNIMITDCIVKPSSCKGDRIIKSTPTGITAISLELVDGGVMDGITVNNIQIDGTECPLYVRLADRGRKHTPDAPQPQVGVMRNIHISNITARNTGNFCSSITGIPGHKIEDITLTNISMTNRGGLQKGSFRTVAADLKSAETDKGVRHDSGKRLFLDRYWSKADEVEEDEKGYPQPTVWGNLPCYGLFMRHVGRAIINNLELKSDSVEPRKPLIAVDVDKLVINGKNK